MWNFVGADNATEAHILLARILLTNATTMDYTAPKVDGEAFSITDGQPHRF